MSEYKLDDGQWAILVPQSAADDPEDLMFAVWDGLDFLRDEVKAAPADLPADVVELVEAADYLGGVYTNFHAIHFANRSDEIGRLDVARRGLVRLGDAEWLAIFDQAMALFAANRALWEQPMGNGTEAKRAAETLMKPADTRYAAHNPTEELNAFMGRALRDLPSVRIVPDDRLAELRDAMLKGSDGFAAAEAEKAAKAAKRAEEEAVASRIRTQNMLKHPVSYAAEALSKRLGFTDVMSPPGEADVSSDGSTEGWTIALRGHGNPAQFHTLARKRGIFFLLNWQDEVIAQASESELERERLTRLGGSEPPRSAPPRPTGFGRFFGRKGL